MAKWSADYGNLHVVVCDAHRTSRKDELSRVRRARGDYSCYFCVRGVP